MAGERERDDSVFEITDFTTVTPWEAFVSSIENVLHQWGLTGASESTDSFTCKQHYKCEKIQYAGWNFSIVLHVAAEKKTPSPRQSDQDWPESMVQMMNSSYDFPPRVHHITRWYGTDQFILVSPDEKSEALISEAQSKLMLSTISLAVSNTGCTTPVFVQVQKHWRQLYVGICAGAGLRTSYNMVHLHHTPPQCNHLSGLLAVFRSKLKSSSLKRQQPVEVAARFTYIIRHWDPNDWPVEPIGDVDGLDVSALSTIPVGATSDPVQELHLSGIWPHLTEETVTDNPTHSDFNPLHASLWTLRMKQVDSPSLQLSALLSSFLKLCYRQESITELLGSKLLQEDIYHPGVGGSDFSHALTRLTEPSTPSLSFSSVMYSASQGLEFSSEFEPINDRQVDLCLRYLFPDASPAEGTMETTRHSYPSFQSMSTECQHSLTRMIKSSPVDSFTSRLSRMLCMINYYHGLRACVSVWYEVVLEMRYRWETGILLPGVDEGYPDMACCLLHQKVQMLNCCIRHKLTHAQKLRSPSHQHTHKQDEDPTSSISTSSLSFSQRLYQRQSSLQDQPTEQPHNHTSSELSDSSDEFFEAPETVQKDSNAETSVTSRGFDNSVLVPVLSAPDQGICDSPSTQPRNLDMQPVPGGSDPLTCFSAQDGLEGMAGEGKGDTGALHQYKDLVLIVTGEPLCVPETQEPTPLTEDMLWEQQSVLSNLGTSHEAAQVRAKMQSLSLVSDMQAFKAANSGCVLEDFVRWYSPRDWMDEGEDDDIKNVRPVKEDEAESKKEHPTDGWETDLDEEWDLVDPALCESRLPPPNERHARGRLSQRMRQPGNMWVEAWESATPLPAYRQKRLFNDTKEAEKVLHHLSGLSPMELSLMLIPSLLHSAISALQEKQNKQPLSVVQGLVQDAINLLSSVQRPTLDTLPIYQECLGMLQDAEHLLATANSLLLKLERGLELQCSEKIALDGSVCRKELEASIEILLTEPELVIGEPTFSRTGNALQGLLTAQGAMQNLEYFQRNKPQKLAASFPDATGREFILRTVEPRPGPLSRPSPQRLFCVLTKDEMRLAGAFTEDTVMT